MWEKGAPAETLSLGRCCRPFRKNAETGPKETLLPRTGNWTSLVVLTAAGDQCRGNGRAGAAIEPRLWEYVANRFGRLCLPETG